MSKGAGARACGPRVLAARPVGRTFQKKVRMPANRVPRGHVYTPEMSESDHNRARRAAAGDRAAFHALVVDHSPVLFRVAWRLMRDEGAAEDVVQEALIKAWNKLPDFRGDASFRSWATRITVNTAMDQLRKQGRRRQHETESLPNAPEAADEGALQPDRQIDLSRQTAAAMEQLSDRERAALMLRHYEGHSISEIAQMLEITTGACKQTIFRAVRKMRVALAPLAAA